MNGSSKPRQKLTPHGHFGLRADRLIKACGWPQSEWRRHFGVSEKAVRRIRYGRGKASVKFVLALEALENLYRPQLDAFDRGEIVVRGRSRHCFVDLPQVAVQRAPDLRGVGAVNSVSDPRKKAQAGVI